MFKECFNCGTTNNIEEHHIVFRSKNSTLIKCKYNIIYLCSYCHRVSKLSPHNNRNTDLKYKMMFQDKLFNLFTKELYQEEEIKNILNISKKDTNKLVKLLDLQILDEKIFYKTEDIIKKCLGGKFY